MRECIDPLYPNLNHPYFRLHSSSHCPPDELVKQRHSSCQRLIVSIRGDDAINNSVMALSDKCLHLAAESTGSVPFLGDKLTNPQYQSFRIQVIGRLILAHYWYTFVNNYVRLKVLLCTEDDVPNSFNIQKLISGIIITIANTISI